MVKRNTSPTIKEEIGSKLTIARVEAGYSRSALSKIIGLSPKTIQSVEKGRTFFEDLEILSQIENCLPGFSFGRVLAEIVDKRKR